MPYLQLGFVSF